MARISDYKVPRCYSQCFVAYVQGELNRKCTSNKCQVLALCSCYIKSFYKMDKNFTWRKLSYSQKKTSLVKWKTQNTFYSRYSGKQVNSSSCQNRPQSKCAHTQWEFFFTVFLQILHHLVLNIACPKELLPLQLKWNEGGQIWSRVTGAAVALFSLRKLVCSVPRSFSLFVCLWVCSTTFVHSFVVLLHCARRSWSECWGQLIANSLNAGQPREAEFSSKMHCKGLNYWPGTNTFRDGQQQYMSN